MGYPAYVSCSEIKFNEEQKNAGHFKNTSSSVFMNHDPLIINLKFHLNRLLKF